MSMSLAFVAGCGLVDRIQSFRQENEEPNQKGLEAQGQQAQQEELEKQIEDLEKQVAAQEQNEERQTSASHQDEPNEEIQNVNTPPSQAPEGVVAVSSDFDVGAASAEEAAAINAAIDYYQYAETGDYYTTYTLLSSESQAYYTEDEWVTANAALDSAAGEFVVTDAYPYDLGMGAPTYAIALTVYLPDGSSFNRTTYFVYERGFWAHQLTTEEVNMFDGALY